MKLSLTAAALVAVHQACSVTAFVPPRSSRIFEPTGHLVPTRASSAPKDISPRSAVAPLQASPLTSLALSPAGSLAILAGIVLIHESGHYLAARSFGIRVEEFSVGVGPKLFGFKAAGDQFNLRALPLGGYVRFPENFDVDQAREKEMQAMKDVSEFTSEKLNDKNKIVLNALTLGAIGDQEIKQENERRLAEAEELKKLPWWKKVGRKAPAPIVGPDEVEIEYYDDPQLLQNRSWKERAVVLSGGIIFNFILSFFIYFGLVSMGPGLPSQVFDSGVVVSAAPRADAAARGVLAKGDVVLSVNGKALTMSQSPSVSESQRGINNFISTIRATPPGEALDLQVLHPGDKQPVHVTLAPKLTNNAQTIGVLLSPNYVTSTVLKSDSVVEAAGIAGKYTGGLIKDTAAGLAGVLKDAVTGNSAGAQISGPIGLIKTGSEVVATKDLTSVFLFAAALSINLGVVNAFPLPALDGGQLLFVFYEAAAGRKVNQRVQEGITGATLFLLLFISFGAAVGDIQKIFLTSFTN